MADLPGTAPISMEETTVDQNTGTDSVRYVDHDQVVLVICISTVHEFADGSCLAVVQDPDRDLEFFLQQFTQRKIAPIQVYGVDNNTFTWLDESWSTHAQPDMGISFFRNKLLMI